MSPHTRASLAADAAALGLGDGNIVMMHAAFSRVGPVLGGPDALVDAVLDVVGPSGTVVSYQDWGVGVDIWNDDGSVQEPLRAHVPPYDPATSRPARDHGILASTIRSRPGVHTSANPGAAMSALGCRADELTRDHPMDDGYGASTPLARIVASGGMVLMVGAPLDTMTVLHHAEATADIPDKRRVRIEYPLRGDDGSTVWRWVEEFDTSRPIVDGLDDDYFASVVEDFLATGSGRRGTIGDADSVLVDAREITAFAVDWLTRRSQLLATTTSRMPAPRGTGPQ
ncbi:aminoglycoside 3-N-acetyltransferase [Rhodococcus sp. BP-252]|uniref:Aminoglycoside N(3)-acetyltransferase n=1 Tax=Rhodococcoides kyotonense TaxID=398843 RepID=A0A177YKD8_9NOCA|nr:MULTISPECIES: aminoglycoside 3-N-acetyltransferase [Rhodococcus]NIL75861.1 SPBc2 prophage-derived aminoglycoside N(3')-acetyltransferase-like protein YokD [Rhodococcus sp. B10]MBY6413757.1 aminoglycoside 3-N-acetyltransferase [Rhodococcus sp. BP-320]MBY6418462.1 aminoglycoside 3-N-acetyltransferase [Rhodococcus sp. BP-321]MBY6422587.1 aminoglycoside 3-N-acetyltransferase [Rhodococcus sp. BP-324]MBY6428396.1 aminoglycoside 3-N-acetyltransferase [Rhodococcus sp. BP-323]